MGKVVGLKSGFNSLVDKKVKEEIDKRNAIVEKNFDEFKNMNMEEREKVLYNSFMMARDAIAAIHSLDADIRQIKQDLFKITSKGTYTRVDESK